MNEEKKHLWIPYLMVLPAFAVMMLVVVLPILNTVMQSFQTEGGSFTLENYQYFFNRPRKHLTVWCLL